MSAANHHSTPDLGSLYLNRDTATRLTTIFAAIGLVGLGGTALGLLSEASRAQALYSYLVAFMFVATIAVGGLFFTVLQHLVGAYWSVTVRRISETLGSALPVVALLFLPIGISLALGNSTLYSWASHENHEVAVRAKLGYLNVPFFLIRAAFYLAVWGVLGTIFYRRSLELDKSGDPEIVLGLRRLSAPAMLLFALSITFAGFDWLMSLDPSWYSTIFGVYVFAGTVLVSLSTITLVALLLRRAGLLEDVITIEHYHDLGKLIFGFTVFWAYIGFSQFFLQWYANLPEETGWFAHRWQGSWWMITVILIFGHFVIPFYALLSRHAKRSPAALGVVGTLFVVIHFVDMHWIVMPELHREGFSFSWLDLAALMGTGGVFLALLCRRLGAAPLVPVKDPLLQASLEFENA